MHAGLPASGRHESCLGKKGISQKRCRFNPCRTRSNKKMSKLRTISSFTNFDADASTTDADGARFLRGRLAGVQIFHERLSRLVKISGLGSIGPKRKNLEQVGFLERFSLRLTQFSLGLLQCTLGFNRIQDGCRGSN